MATKTTDTPNVAKKYQDLSIDTQLFIERYGAPDEDFGWKDGVSPEKKSRTLQWKTTLPVVVEITDSVDEDDVLELPEIRYHEKPDGSWKVLNSLEKMMSKLVELGVKPKDPSRIGLMTPIRWTYSKMPSLRTIGTVVGSILLVAVIVVVVGYAVANGIEYFKSKPATAEPTTTATAPEPEKKGGSWWPSLPSWMTWKKADTTTVETKVTTDKGETTVTTEVTEPAETVTPSVVVVSPVTPPTAPPTPVPSTATVVNLVKEDVRAQVQKSLNEATNAYMDVKREFDAATLEMRSLDEAKAALGSAWCKENQDKWDAAKARADAAQMQMNGLNLQISALEYDLKNGTTTSVQINMMNGLGNQMVGLETRVGQKLDATVTELKDEMKLVKTAVADMKKELLEKIAALETSIGSKIAGLLTKIASAMATTDEGIKDLTALVETTKKEVEKHKGNPSRLDAIELRLKALSEKVSELATAPPPKVEEPKPTPVKPTSVPMPTPTVYAPQSNCQPGWTCPNQQFRYAQPVYGYRQN